MQADCRHLPAPTGRLFGVTLRLHGDLRAGVLRLTGNGFLGGVLHGAVRSRWFDLAGLAAQGPGHRPRQQGPAEGLSWRILLPPPRLADGQACDTRPGAVHDLEFGILMHGGHPALWHDAQRALESLTELSVGALRVPVSSVHCLHRSLPAGAALALDGCGNGLGAEPALPAALSLHWCTPLHLASRSKIEAGHGGAPPSLLGVVRSLRRRVGMLEPAWANALGLDSDAWVAAEEALRRTQACDKGAARNRIQGVVWRYGSRTKSAPFLRHGLIGCQVFRAPATAALLGLLSIGAWLGAGEGASFGCGQYRWRVRLPNGQRAPALLPQPWSGVNGALVK